MTFLVEKFTSLVRWFRPRDNTPVRLMHSLAISVTLASLVAVIIANLTSTQPSRISLSMSDAMVQAGQQFTVQVHVDATVPVNAVSLDVQFDPNFVEVLGINRGESVITLWTEDPKVIDNMVLLRGGTYRRGFIGRHLIATVRVKAVETGRATFSVADAQLLSGDGTGDLLAYTTQDNVPRVTIVSTDTPLVSEADLRTIAEFGPNERITMREVSIFMAAWSNREVMYDFNNDGKMNLRDFSILLYRYFASR